MIISLFCVPKKNPRQIRKIFKVNIQLYIGRGRESDIIIPVGNSCNVCDNLSSYVLDLAFYVECSINITATKKKNNIFFLKLSRH
jgi:hypothetical protein